MDQHTFGIAFKAVDWQSSLCCLGAHDRAKQYKQCKSLNEYSNPMLLVAKTFSDVPNPYIGITCKLCAL